MMKTLHHEYGVKDVTIWDDNYFVNRQRIQEICELLIREKMDLNYTCQASVNFGRPELMKILKASGCWQIAWGMESGSQTILKFYEKHIKLPQTLNAVKFSKEAGILNNGYFIMGNPRETKETLQETLDFIRGLKLDNIQVHPLCPLPNTKFYAEAKKYGTVTEDWGADGFITVSYVPNGFTRHEIEAACKEAYRIVYFTPRNIWRNLKRLLNPFYYRRSWKLLRSVWGLLKYMMDRHISTTGKQIEEPMKPQPVMGWDSPPKAQSQT